MNILDAAYEVLKSAKKAMTPKEIVALVLDSGMWTTTGKTPWDTLAAALYCDIKNNGKGSRFSKVGKGQLFALNETAVVVWGLLLFAVHLLKRYRQKVRSLHWRYHLDFQ